MADPIYGRAPTPGAPQGGSGYRQAIGATGGTAPPAGGLDPNGPEFDNAFTMIAALLESWGLSELAPTVRDMLVGGDSADVIPLKLRETEPYKQRFKANFDRTKAGLPALSEAEFLTTESALKRVVRRYVGTGMYDTKDATDKLISGDVSPQELEQRMDRYRRRYLETKDTVVQRPDGTSTTVEELWAERGLTPQHALMGIMDPSITDVELERQANTYALGAATVRAFGDAQSLNVGRLGNWVDEGVDLERVQQQLNDVASRYEYEDMLARASGTDLSRDDQIDAAITGDADINRRRQRVLGDDQARFGQQSFMGGATKMTRDPRGSY